MEYLELFNKYAKKIPENVIPKYEPKLTNLLTETLEYLEECNISEADILWVGTQEYKFTWEDFKRVADTLYDFTGRDWEVATDLMIVGDGWWLERIMELNEMEYPINGWEFHCIPEEPEFSINLKALTTHQSKELGLYSEDYTDLCSLNGIFDPII